MPQMAPILWLNLTIMFLFTFIIFIVMNYYISIPLKIGLKEPSSGLMELELNWLYFSSINIFALYKLSFPISMIYHLMKTKYNLTPSV